MSVRAKFKVQSLEPEGGKVELMAVYSADPNDENHQYWKATPYGRIDMQILNEAATQQFELGKEYYVTFEPVGEQVDPTIYFKD